MHFLALSNANFQFGVEELIWRSYTVAEALPTTSRVELIDKREFVKAILDGNSETFVVHVSTLEISTAMPIHLSRVFQLQDDLAQIAALWWDKGPTEIPAKYSDYADVFSSDLAIELLENISMNKHAIELIKEKQPPYRFIYALSQVELEMLKTYIKIHLKTGFIWPYKSLARAPIFFDKKPNGSFCLNVNYWGLNNLRIKNQYPLPLISESLDQLGRAKWFTH